MTWREEIIGDARLILGDCREILPTLGKVDAVVTDPPYGLSAERGIGTNSRERFNPFVGTTAWDDAPVDAAILAEIAAKGEHAIIWGGNYFALPPSSCWLIWDKETAGITTFADCEVAWTNLPKAMRLKRHLWSGPYMKVKEDRVHPTQKPLAIMLWCLEQVPSAKTILDPYAGSGTTGIACAQTGRSFIGIERDPGYFDIACRRIEEAYRQPRLFEDAPPKPVQDAFSFDGAA